MKRVEAIVPHSMMSQTTRALEELGVHFTHYDTRGWGKTPALTVEFYRGTGTMREEFNENVTIMTIVTDSMVDKVVEQILNNTSGGEGKIFVCEVKDAIDIRSKKRGDSAL